MALTVSELQFIFSADDSKVDRSLDRMDRKAGTTASGMTRRMGGFWDTQERRSGRLSNVMRKGFLAAGAALTGLGLGALAFGKQAVDLEATYSKTFREIAVAGDVPAKKLRQLDDLAVKLGKDTTFSAADASEAMLELVKNGIKPATVEAGALDSALTLAAAGGLSMESAASTMGNSLNAFGLEGKDAASVAAALAGAANASSASVESLAMGLQQASAVSHDAGLSIQETTAALAAFSNAGIASSDAGTSLKTFLSRLVPQTDKAKGKMMSLGLVTYDANVATKALAEQGIKAVGEGYDGTLKSIEKWLIKTGEVSEAGSKSRKLAEAYMWSFGIMNSAFEDSKGNFEDLATISEALKKSLSGLSDSERATAMNTLFGSDARRAATILMREGRTGIEEYIKATSDQTQAEKLAKTAMEGTSGAIEALKGSAETAALQFGKGLAPSIVDTSNAVADMIDSGDFEQWGRRTGRVISDFVGWLRDDATPAAKVLWNELEPIADEALPAIATSAEITRDAFLAMAPALKATIAFFNDMPDWAKTLVVGGVVTSSLGRKLGVGKASQGIGSALGITGRGTPVYVTNWAQGAAADGGVGGVVGGGPKATSALRFAGKLVLPVGLGVTIGAAIGGAINEAVIGDDWETTQGKRGVDSEIHAEKIGDSFRRAQGDVKGFGLEIETTRDRITEMTNGITGFASETERARDRVLALTRPRYKVHVTTTGLDSAINKLETYKQMLDRVTTQGQVRDAAGGGFFAGTGYTPPGRAKGGDVRPGRFYMVGENGPELFESSSAGRIHSNPASRAMTQETGSSQGALTLDTDSINRLAQTLLLARPLHGDVYMQPHNYNEFRREMHQGDRSAALTGGRQGR